MVCRRMATELVASQYGLCTINNKEIMKPPTLIILTCLCLLHMGQNSTAQELRRIKVFNESDLRTIAHSSTQEGQSYGDALITLETDITISGEPWYPIGLPPVDGMNSFPFQGEFDGQGHTITFETSLEAVKWENDRYSGLFGFIGKYGLVKNLSIIMHSVEVSVADGTNNGYFGVVSGFNAGEITDCSVSGDIRLSSPIVYNFFRFGCIAGLLQDGMVFNNNNHATVSTMNISCVGGIVGETYGGILNHNMNFGSISTSGFAEIGGDLKCVGGIVGSCEGHNEDDYSYVINCLNSGKVQVDENALSAGGIVGTCSSGILFYSGNSGDVVSDAAYSGGIIGHMINSAVYGSFHHGKIRSKKRITSSNSIVGFKNWGDDEIVKDCYIVNDRESLNTQTTVNTKVISQESFVRKVNAVFPKSHKGLMKIVEDAGWWKGAEALFAAKAWVIEQEYPYPCFSK